MSADGSDAPGAETAAAAGPQSALAPRMFGRADTPRALTPALFLRDPSRRRLLWANAQALALIGAPTLAQTPAETLAALNAALDAALDAARGGHGDAAVLPGARGPVAGRLERRRVALPDGRLGERVMFAPDPAAGARPPAPAHGDRAEALISATALARLAHEFRSPLTAVLGFSEFLRENLDDLPPERIHAYLDDLSLAATRMRRLADDLVAIGAGGGGMTVAETDLDALLDSAARLAAPQARALGVRLAPIAPPQQRRLIGLVDADALARAVGNLLDNAIRHGASPSGGVVRLSLEDRGRDGGAEIVVADDGPGLDAQALAEAMLPYGRAGDGGAGAAGGLGLPIVREIAEAHGGALRMDTAPGAGLRACIALPAARVFRGGPGRRR